MEPVKPYPLNPLEAVPLAGSGDLVIPLSLQQALQANTRAWQHFLRLPPAHRRKYVQWIMGAKRETTQLRRTQKAIRLLETTWLVEKY